MLSKVSSASPQEVLSPPAANLDDLAREVRDAHQTVGVALGNALIAAMRAGDALIAARQHVPEGKWTQWVEDHCEISERTARAYIRVAQARPELEDRQRVAGPLSFRAALEYLREPRDSRGRPKKRSKPSKANLAWMGRHDALAWWIQASLEERQQFVNSIGRAQWHEAQPETWHSKPAPNGKPERDTAAELPPPSEAGMTADPKKDGTPRFCRSIIARP
jgi:hypothetical protein